MAARRRDYAAEYAARKARDARLGRARDYRAEYRDRLRRLEAGAGLTRRAARGHPRLGDVGAAELRQLRRAAALASPGGLVWDDARQTMTRGPAVGSDPERQAAADRVAELSGAPSPVGMSLVDRAVSVYGARAFAEEFVRLGLGTEQQAYTLWFSP